MPTSQAGFERALAHRSGRMDRNTFTKMLQIHALQWDPVKRLFLQALPVPKPELDNARGCCEKKILKILR